MFIIDVVVFQNSKTSDGNIKNDANVPQNTSNKNLIFIKKSEHEFGSEQKTKPTAVRKTLNANPKLAKVVQIVR